MVAVPSLTPVIMPVVGPEVAAVATPVAPLVHVPPGVVLERVVVAPPSHTFREPVMAPGSGSMVTSFVTKPQPVNVIVVVPELIPVTTPDAFTVALAGVELLHVPPGTPLESVMVLPGHTLPGPVMAVGTGSTVTGFIA